MGHPSTGRSINRTQGKLRAGPSRPPRFCCATPPNTAFDYSAVMCIILHKIRLALELNISEQMAYG